LQSEKATLASPEELIFNPLGEVLAGKNSSDFSAPRKK
jgi:hypothetical protein